MRKLLSWCQDTPQVAFSKVSKMAKVAEHGDVKPHTEGEEESRWIDLAIKGNQEAFAHLYHRYHSQVHAFCVRMLQGRGDVEDAAQQVFLEAWKSLHRFERRSLFSTWITRIAIHTCLSAHRKRNRMRLMSEEKQNPWENVTEFVWREPESSPDVLTCFAERKRAVGKILNRMTKKKQAVFMMSDMQGLTAPEISGILGIPDATVRTRLFHARREFANTVNRNPVYRDLLRA